MTGPLPLLCETCGYDLAGLGTDAGCPECGRSIESSLPGRRVGSAWQRRPGLGGWWATLCGLGRPGAMFDVVTIERRRAGWLGWCNAWLTALTGGGAAAGLWLGLSGRLGDALVVAALGGVLGSVLSISASHRHAVGLTIGVWAIGGGALMLTGPALRVAIGLATLAWLGGLVLVAGLTWVEQRGVRFWSARRGLRITRDAAAAITAHASYGWLLSGLGVGLAVFVGTWDPARRFFGGIEVLGSRRLGQILTWPVYLGLAAAPGLIVFETLVYLGVRRCRYANASVDPDGGAAGVAGTSNGCGRA